MTDQKAVLKKWNRIKSALSRYHYVTLEAMTEEHIDLEIRRMTHEDWNLKSLERPYYKCGGTGWYPAWLTFRRLKRR